LTEQQDLYIWPKLFPAFNRVDLIGFHLTHKRLGGSKNRDHAIPFEKRIYNPFDILAPIRLSAEGNSYPSVSENTNQMQFG
jgi:hypothetical protein